VGTIEQAICWFGMRNDIDSPGFTAPCGRALGRERHNIAPAELVTIVGLALSTIIAATAVTVGIAHADVAGNVIDNEGSLFAVALLLGIVFIGIGGYSALTLPFHRHKKH
jgi:heme/copper-type cytochrome/quinol oxidase subunit 3